MTVEEYEDKWMQRCMKCSSLAYKSCESDEKFLFFCVWADGRMDAVDNDTDALSAIKIMLRDEKNISRTCVDYVERLMDLYSLNDEK